MNNEERPSNDTLHQLKCGSILVKLKMNGKKYSRRFFLDKLESFISYDKSRKVLGQPAICK